MMKCAGILLFGGLLFVAAGASADLKALTGATLFDGSGAAPVEDAVVIIRDDRILEAGPANEVAIPEEAKLVALTGQWIIPGLIDAHVHFFQSGSVYARPDVIDLRHVRAYDREIEQTREKLPDTLQRYIDSGVTTVVDLAGPAWTYALRSLSQAQESAPRVVLSGPGLAPGLPSGLNGPDAPALKVRTSAQARAAIRRLAADEPDLVKIWFAPQPGMDLARELQWIRAAIDEAHTLGLRVAVHATKLHIAREMVRAGADILVHSIDDRPIEPSLLSLMRSQGTVYIPTLEVGRRYTEVLGQELVLSPFERAMGDPTIIATLDDLQWVSRKRPSRGETHDSRTVYANLVRVQRSGVTIAAGSDAGNIGSLHGPALHVELERMAEAGLSPEQVLVSATRGGALVAGRDHDLGVLAPGMLADLLVLDASPLEDIRNTRRLVLVMKGGQILRCLASALPSAC